MDDYRIQQAYEALSDQPGVADWAWDEVYQFLLGEGLSDDEAHALTTDCRGDAHAWL